MSKRGKEQRLVFSPAGRPGPPSGRTPRARHRHLLSRLAIAAATGFVHTAWSASTLPAETPASPQALMELGKRHEYGVGATQDMDRAIELYCDAARQGYGEAAYQLGWIYATGRNGKVDEVLAAAWFTEAKSADHPRAHQKLRTLGADGLSLGQDADCVLRADMVARRLEKTSNPAPVEKKTPSGIAVRELDTSDIRSLVRSLAPHYNLDPELVLAVISVESNFNPEARSPKNAQGLMQLIPETASRFGVRNVWDPLDNLRGGMAYLRWLLDNFSGNVEFALAGYNAGENAVERHGGIPPYEETQNYVRRITKMLEAKAKTNPPEAPPATGEERLGGNRSPAMPQITLADRS